MTIANAAVRHAGANGIWLSSTFAAALALSAFGCEDSSPSGDGATNGGGPGTSGQGSPQTRAPYDIEGCVVSVLANDCSGALPAPHEIELLNARTGEPLPGFKTTSGSGGKYAFKNVPGDIEVAVHAKGVGPADVAGSTYDSIAVHVPESGDNLMRVSSVGTAGLAGAAAGFTPADDKAALSGAVYQVNDQGRRVGAIGCAKVYLDDEPHPALSADQRYNASSGIPTTLTELQQTLANSGRFYFGNLSKGEHKLRVSLDEGRTFIAEKTVFVGKSRQEAASPFKAILYLVGIDVKGPNPTTATCPSEVVK